MIDAMRDTLLLSVASFRPNMLSPRRDNKANCSK